MSLTRLSQLVASVLLAVACVATIAVAADEEQTVVSADQGFEFEASGDDTAATGGDVGGGSSTGAAGGDVVVGADGGPGTAGRKLASGPGSTSGTGDGSGGGGSDDPVSTDPNLPPIKLAYVVTDADGAGALTGGSSVGEEQAEAARQEREFKALIEWANANGGVAGRRIDAKGFVVTLEEQANEESQAQKCVEIVEDYGAHFAVDASGLSFPTAQSCFAQHGVVLVTDSTVLDESMARSFRPYVATTWPTIDRMFTAMVPRLQGVGYFEGATVGVFLDDRPHVVDTYERVLLPALRATGVEPKVTAKAGQSDTARQGAAVLDFANADVNRVIFVGNTLHWLGFAQAADTQGFRPRYAFPDYFEVAASAAYVGPPSQLKDAVAVSSCDYYLCIVEGPNRNAKDLTSPYDRAAASPGLQRCLDTLSAARGVDYWQPATAAPSANHYLVCDHFLLWLDAARAVGAGVTPKTWAQGLRVLGASYPSAVIHGTDFGDGRSTGAAEFAAGTYDNSCVCYVRRTPWQR